MQKKQIWQQTCLLVFFLTTGGIVSAFLRYELTYDLLLYHYYNGFSFLNNRLNVDIAPAAVATYYNPMLDALSYLLNNLFENNTTAYCFTAGLPFGLLMFLTFKIACLFFRLDTIKGKICVPATVIIASTGVATWFQIGTCSHEIILADLILIAFYRLLKFPEKKTTFFLSGFLLGCAAGFKLTAVIYCLSCFAVLLCSYKSLKNPKTLISLFICGGVVGYFCVNGYWAVLLWRNFDNPVFPFWNKIFNSPYYLDENYVDRLHLAPLKWYHFVFFPFFLILHPYSSKIGALQEFTDFRFCFLFFVGFICLFKCHQTSFTPVMKKTIFFTLFSYIIWLSISANLRFTIPLEVTGAILLVSFFSSLKKPERFIAEALYHSLIIIVFFILISTTFLSHPWGKRQQEDFLKEEIILPAGTVLETYRFPLAGIAAQIARKNPDIKIISYAPPDQDWYSWDIARMNEMKEKTTALLQNSTMRAALYHDAFGLVEQENPELKQWNCRTLRVSDSIKPFIFSKLKLCIKPDGI